MAVTAVALVKATAVATSASALYTVPDNTTVQVKKLTVSNPTGAARKVSIWLLATGQAADDTAILVKQKTIASLDTYEAYVAEGHIIAAAGTIQALGDAAGLIIQASGITIV